LETPSKVKTHPRIIPLQALLLLLDLLGVTFQLEPPYVCRGTFVSREIGSIDIEAREDVV
jgi:hypothetical protein